MGHTLPCRVPIMEACGVRRAVPPMCSESRVMSHEYQLSSNLTVAHEMNAVNAAPTSNGQVRHSNQLRSAPFRVGGMLHAARLHAALCNSSLAATRLTPTATQARTVSPCGAGTAAGARRPPHVRPRAARRASRVLGPQVLHGPASQRAHPPVARKLMMAASSTGWHMALPARSLS